MRSVGKALPVSPVLLVRRHATPPPSHTLRVQVLIIGGQGATGGSLASTEVFDPVTGVFSRAATMFSARHTHSATLLSSGKVLVAGGAVFSDVATVLCEVYDPATNTFSGTGPLLSPRKEHSAVLLPNGQVCVKCG